MSTQLSAYIGAYNALQNHKEKNSGVFKEHEQILMHFIDAENELRDHVALTKQGETEAGFTVSVEEYTQEVFDEEATLKALRMTKQEAIDAKILQVNKRHHA